MFEKRKDNPEPPAEVEPSTEATDTVVNPPRSSAVIGQTIKVKGTITGDENLLIEGTVEGSVSLPKHDLTVGSSGSLQADISAKTVRIDGQVTGDISGVEKVIVSKTGHVRGNIVAPRVTLEDGAKFKGAIDMDPSDTAKRQAAPPKSQPKAEPQANEAQQEAG